MRLLTEILLKMNNKLSGCELQTGNKFALYNDGDFHFLEV